MTTSPQKLLVGTYTERLPHVDGHATGIVAADYADGYVHGVSVPAELRNPSWLTTTRDGRFLYAVIETKEFDGAPGGGVAAYARDPESGALTALGTQPSDGVEPAHLELDPSERFVIVANYRTGSITVFPREANGALGAQLAHVQHEGATRVNPERQEGPHAHQILFDPVTGDFLVPDLGLDAVLGYHLGDDGSLTPRPDLNITDDPGAGPRHLAFHPDGKHLFLLNELNNTLIVLRRTESSFERTDAASTLPAGFTGHSQTSALKVSSSGATILASNRGYDSIAVFAFDAASSTVELRLVQPSLGREPRDFIQTPDGDHLVVGNQDSDTLVVFAFDESVPSLTPVSTIGVPTPVCLRFV